MTTEILKEIYFRELDIKAQLDSRLTVYVAVMTATGGLIAFLFKCSWPAMNYIQYASLILAVSSTLLLATAIVCAFMSNLGYVYQRLPSSEDLLNYSKELEEYYLKNPQVAGAAPEEYDQYIKARLAKASTRNAHNNLKRSAYYYRSTLFIMWSFVSSGLSGITLAANQVYMVISIKGQ